MDDTRRVSAVKVAITCLIAMSITVGSVLPIIFLPKPPLAVSATIAADTLRKVLGGDWNIDPCVSPDSSRIAFASNRTGSYQIWTVDIDGSHLTRLTDSAGSKSDPQWSHDSGMIAFLSTSGSVSSLWTMKTDVSELSMISVKGESVQDFSWSSVGNIIAYDENVSGKWIIYTSEIRALPLQLTKGDYNSLYPSWAPNGKELVFSSDRNGNYDLFVQNMVSGNATQLTSAEGSNFLARYNPQGNEIVFMSNRTGSWSIWTENVNGSSPANLLDPNQEFREPIWAPTVDLSADPTWNPSGLSILFTSSDTTSSSDAFVIQPNVLVPTDELGTVTLGLVQTRISANLTGADYACWAPDGSGIVLSNKLGSDNGIWIIRFTPVTATNPYGS